MFDSFEISDWLRSAIFLRCLQEEELSRLAGRVDGSRSDRNLSY